MKHTPTTDENDGDEIDWTRDPINDFEVALRASIIRQIIENDREGMLLRGPYWVCVELEDLLPRGSFPVTHRTPVGSDLRAAIERCRDLFNRQIEAQHRESHDALVANARRDVGVSAREFNVLSQAAKIALAAGDLNQP